MYSTYRLGIIPLRLYACRTCKRDTIYLQPDKPYPEPPPPVTDRSFVFVELDRRKPGQSRITTPRNEDDRVEILSGLSPEGLTLGTPIAMLVRNKVRCLQQRCLFSVGLDEKCAYHINSTQQENCYLGAM